MATRSQTFSVRPKHASPIATAVCANTRQLAGASDQASSHDDAPCSEDLDSDEEDEFFYGTVVQFPDGSQWEVRKRLSGTKLQQYHSPCEATQVLTAFCVKDLSGRYYEGAEAVIKIKLQVQASAATIEYYQDCKRTLKRAIKKGSADGDDIEKEIERVHDKLQECTKPTTKPNPDALNEVMALQYLLEYECPSAPWLLSFAKTTLQLDMHMLGVEGGYLMFTLMTKLPGTPLSYSMLCKVTPEERNSVRKAFRKALNDVRNIGIIPTDTCLSNILWDKESETCYIVDFEHCEVPTSKEKVILEFQEDDYMYWSLDEKLYEFSGCF